MKTVYAKKSKILKIVISTLGISLFSLFAFACQSVQKREEIGVPEETNVSGVEKEELLSETDKKIASLIETYSEPLYENIYAVGNIIIKGKAPQGGGQDMTMSFDIKHYYEQEKSRARITIAGGFLSSVVADVIVKGDTILADIPIQNTNFNGSFLDMPPFLAGGLSIKNIYDITLFDFIDKSMLISTNIIETNDMLILKLEYESHNDTLFFDEGGTRVRTYLSRSYKNEVRIDYDDYTEIGEYVFPKSIIIRDKRTGEEARVHYRSVQLNDDVTWRNAHFSK